MTMHAKSYSWSLYDPLAPLGHNFNLFTEPEYEILEDGPWSPLYDFEDYVGIAHQVLAMHLGLA